MSGPDSDALVRVDARGALRLEADTQRDLGRGHDFALGAAAFRDRRAPVFEDHRA